jgi:hypothetical protein
MVAARDERMWLFKHSLFVSCRAPLAFKHGFCNLNATLPRVMTPPPPEPPYIADKSKFSTGIVILLWLGNFFVTPLIGLLMWLFMKDSQPLKARQAGLPAMIAGCTIVALGVLGVVGAIMIPTALRAREKANDDAMQKYARQVYTSAQVHYSNTNEIVSDQDCSNGYEAATAPVAAPTENWKRAIITCVVKKVDGNIKMFVETRSGAKFSY